MCNIIILSPGQMPVESDLYNMCYNNWHSYGLVSVIDNKLNIVRKVPETGEVDPAEVYGLLTRDRQYTRYLHVRHNTVGATSLENTHPFDVYYTDVPHRQVLFMHNGTLYDYKPKDTNTYSSAACWKDSKYVSSDNTDGDSDTKKFTEEVLQPLAPLCKGDFSLDAMKMVLKKIWPAHSNRGLIIANDIEPILLGDWKDRKDTNGGTYKTSNDDYFNSVTRGPQKSRIEAEAKRKEEEKKRSSIVSEVNTGRSPFRTETGTIFQLPSNWPVVSAEYQSIFHLKTEAKGLIGELDFWSRENAVSVGALTGVELQNIASDPEVAVALMAYVFNDYSALYDEFCEAKTKHEAASNIIAQLKNQISVLESSRVLN